uniref:B30.2/SPRY domain-containing protein n=1 Tax=Ditylenchus dipsaci TaxID=166011 RepID=A0A915EAU0_9BILA
MMMQTYANIADHSSNQHSTLVNCQYSVTGSTSSNNLQNADLKTTIDQDDKHTKDSLTGILQNLKIDSPSWSWDRKAAKSTCASEAVFSQENSTVIFHPSYSFGTAAVFGDKPLESKLVSYWEVILPRCYGTSMMLGLGTRRAKTHSPTRFEHLLRSKYSCGLAHNGYLYRGDSKVDLPTQFCAPFPQDKQVVVGMMFHGPHKWLAYFLDGKPLGVAFRGLDMAGEQLFLCTAQKSQFTLEGSVPCIDEDTSKIVQLNIPEVLANSLYNSICSRQDFHRRKKKKPKKKPGPTTTSSSIGRKRKGGWSIPRLFNSLMMNWKWAGCPDW